MNTHSPARAKFALIKAVSVGADSESPTGGALAQGDAMGAGNQLISVTRALDTAFPQLTRMKGNEHNPRPRLLALGARNKAVVHSDIE